LAGHTAAGPIVTGTALAAGATVAADRALTSDTLDAGGTPVGITGQSAASAVAARATGPARAAGGARGSQAGVVRAFAAGGTIAARAAIAGRTCCALAGSGAAQSGVAAGPAGSAVAAGLSGPTAAGSVVPDTAVAAGRAVAARTTLSADALETHGATVGVTGQAAGTAGAASAARSADTAIRPGRRDVRIRCPVATLTAGSAGSAVACLT
jgi:hypothetical protein